jgi:hypothetical protein
MILVFCAAPSRPREFQGLLHRQDAPARRELLARHGQLLAEGLLGALTMTTDAGVAAGVRDAVVLLCEGEDGGLVADMLAERCAGMAGQQHAQAPALDMTHKATANTAPLT